MNRPTPERLEQLLAEYGPERRCPCDKHQTPRLDAHELADEVRALRAELVEERMANVREPGCRCTWEVGDSPCPVHPLDPDTELPYTAAKAAQLAAELVELRNELEQALRE